MDFILRILTVFLAVLHAYPIAACFGIVLFFCFGLALSRFLPRRLALWLLPLTGLLFVVFMVNLFAGHFVRNALLLRVGVEAEGMVVASSETNVRYNDQPVWRHEVMLKPKGVPVSPISTYGLTSDFNLTPHAWDEGFAYPAAGVRFNARFLPDFPRAFVILTEDDSEYSKGLKCQRSAQQQATLRARLRMVPESRQDGRELASALEIYYYQLDCDKLKSNRFLMDSIDKEIAALRSLPR